MKHPRAAFTLIELLVVIAIIGVLVGLLLPAVQSARAAARRMQCSNHMRQMGLAVANYHSAFKKLPLAWWLETPPTRSFNGKVWGISILPFIEEQALFEQYDHSRLPVNEFSPRNVALVQTPVSTYLCPSSPGNPESRRYDFNEARFRVGGFNGLAKPSLDRSRVPADGVRGLNGRSVHRCR